MNKKIIISILITIAVIIGAFLLIKNVDKKPGALDSFAMCLEESGATFYGAFWCPHCQEQKMMFGRKSAKLLPYVECSTPDGKGQNQVCTDAGIESYPTWDFADGERRTGALPLATLSEKTSCVLPE